MKTESNDRWISVRKEIFADGKFIPIFALKDIKLTYSETLMLSILTNAACVYARSDIGFVLPSSSVKNISKMLTVTDSLSINTVKSNLASLIEKGLISRDDENGGAYVINPIVAERYSSLFKVGLSEKATALLNKRALNTVISYIDNPLTRIIRAKRSEIIAPDSQAIDVVDTYDGTLVIEGTHYIDTDGSVQSLDSSLPFYENSLSQHQVPRLNESFPSSFPSISVSINGCRYNEVDRSQFYALSELQKWHVTLDEALDDKNLAQEATEVNSFTSGQLKQIIVRGVAGNGCRKRFKLRASNNVGAPIKNSACTHQKSQTDRQKTSHIKNEVKNDFKNEKKNAAHPSECASCNAVASLALGESNTVTASGVYDLDSAVKHFTEISNLIQEGNLKRNGLTPVCSADFETEKASGGRKDGATAPSKPQPQSHGASDLITLDDLKAAVRSQSQPQSHSVPDLTLDDLKAAVKGAIALKDSNEPMCNASRPAMGFSEILRNLAFIARGED